MDFSILSFTELQLRLVVLPFVDCQNIVAVDLCQTNDEAQHLISNYGSNYFFNEFRLHRRQRHQTITITAMRMTPPTHPIIMINVLVSAKRTIGSDRICLRRVTYSNRSPFVNQIYRSPWELIRVGSTVSLLCSKRNPYLLNKFHTCHWIDGDIWFQVDQRRWHEERIDWSIRRESRVSSSSEKRTQVVMMMICSQEYLYSWVVLTINFSFTSQRNVDESDCSASILINLIASPWFFNKTL
jgi:hypothetical protein